MLDDALLQRGIEDYLSKRAKKYPCLFYQQPHENEHETAKRRQEAIAKGEDPASVEPVFEMFDYARITKSDIGTYDGPVTEAILKDFGDEYERWKAGKEGQEGTPLDQWGKLDDRQKLALQMWQIHTVEQFIALDPKDRQKIGPAMDRLALEAKRFLGQVYTDKHKEQEQKKEARIAELEAKLEQLVAQQSRPTQQINSKDNRR